MLTVWILWNIVKYIKGKWFLYKTEAGTGLSTAKCPVQSISLCLAHEENEFMTNKPVIH